MPVWTLSFEELTLEDVPRVGGKNASLGEMVRELGPKGVAVPGGFATTADAYRYFLDHNGLKPVISDTLDGLDLDDVADLQRRGRIIRGALMGAELPADLREQILAAYAELSGDEAHLDVAVRSSATAEDLPEASFAGQQETYLNVHTEAALLDTVQRCYASLFTDRAISYRTQRGFDHSAVALSVGVQRMVRSDLGAAGVMFTIDTETGFEDMVLINAAWGLGESVVQGSVVPDEFAVFKPTLMGGHSPIVRKSLGSKELRIVYDAGGSRLVRTERVPQADRDRFCISDEDVLELARQACIIEAHYSERAGHPMPMDIEWGKDGRTGELFILQARPETVQARRDHVTIEQYALDEPGEAPAPVLRGRAVGDRIASGRVRVIRDASQLGEFETGEILVSEITDPDWEPVMRRAAAIITERGGRTCHAAIVSRELGVPAVVGAENARALLEDGEIYTVDCATAEQAAVYPGALPFHVSRTVLEDTRRPRTRIMMNVGNPSEALRLAHIPCDGIGLAREEFIVTSSIGIHPMALVRFDELTDGGVRAEIRRRTRGWTDKAGFYVDKLAEGVGMIAAAFHPRPVIVRLSDFKTNEYANLVGGSGFEPHEENPMIGFRGASRYTDPRYVEAFALECRALRKVRAEMGLSNVKLMVPFCRTVAEGRAVIAAMAEHGLVQGEDGLEIYVMCEVPSNAVLVEQFATVFDGFSIGSNDLTQLTLGLDRDSEIIAHLFDERNDAVKAVIEMAIKGAQAAGRPIGICGQAPSDFPEFAAWLVELGIDSISLNPDAVISTTARVLRLETAGELSPAAD